MSHSTLGALVGDLNQRRQMFAIPGRPGMLRARLRRSGKIGGHALLRGRSDRPGIGLFAASTLMPRHARAPAGEPAAPSHRVVADRSSRCLPIRGWARCSSAADRCTRAPARCCDSAAGDLILTAAHCVAEGVDATFVAGLQRRRRARGRLARRRGLPRPALGAEPGSVGRLRDRAGAAATPAGRWRTQAGGGLTLGRRPETGHRRHRHRLRDGRRRRADRLQDGRRRRRRQGFPALDCAGLVDGLSGAPWIDGSTVTGLIGGLDGGGCEDESVSYSPPFDDAIAALLARAEAGGPADDAPTVFDDDCD